MESKTVIMTALLLSLVLGKIRAEEIVCCPTNTAVGYFLTCISKGGPKELCAFICGCKIISGNECPSGWKKDILENTGDNVVNEYCKLGCSSSVCGAISTLQNSDASEVVNGAVEKCNKACSAFCTKGSITAVETA